MDRRGFMTGILAACAAPAIVRADSLMRIVPRDAAALTPQMIINNALQILDADLNLRASAHSEAALRELEASFRFWDSVFSDFVQQQQHLVSPKWMN